MSAERIADVVEVAQTVDSCPPVAAIRATPAVTVPSIGPSRPGAVLTVVVTWFWVGCLPRAPGTWGSLAALPFAWLLAASGGTALLLGATLALLLIGIGCSGLYARQMADPDPAVIVVDEVVGQWLAVAALPLDPFAYALAFLLFRVFDITKPNLAGWADRTLPGGFGVMMDDVIAGAYAGGLTLAILAVYGSLEG